MRIRGIKSEFYDNLPYSDRSKIWDFILIFGWIILLTCASLLGWVPSLDQIISAVG